MRLQGKVRGARAGVRRQTLSAPPLVRAIAAIAAVTLACAVCPTAMAHPAWGIVVDPSGQIYFSDLETIWKVDREGRLSIARPGMSGRHVHELALEPGGRIRGQDFSYAPDSGRYRQAIWELAPSGHIAWLLTPTENMPRGRSLWSDPDGNTYAVDQNDNTRQQTRILKRTPNGRVTVLAGDTYGHRDGTGAGAKLENIVGITVGPDHALYVTDNSTVRRVSFHGVVTTLASNFDDVPKLSAGLAGGRASVTSSAGVKDFRVVRTAGSPGVTSGSAGVTGRSASGARDGSSGVTSGRSSVARDGSGVTSGRTSVARGSAALTGGGAVGPRGAGTSTSLGAQDRLDFGELMGIATTPSRGIYVADFRNRRVVKVDRAGRKSIVLAAEAPWSPTGVALGPDDAVYALEVGFRPPGTWMKPRVRRVSRDGLVTLIANVPN